MITYNKVVICILASILIIISTIYIIKLRTNYIYRRDKTNYLSVGLEKSDSISEEEKVSLRNTLKSNIRSDTTIYVFGTIMNIAGILLGCFLYYLILKQ